MAAQSGNFASRIREMRKRLGITQVVLAQKLGTTPETINRYENGVRSPPAELLIRLASLDESINAGWLLTGTGAMFREGGPAPAADADVATEALREELGVQVEQWRHVAEERDKRIAALEREVEHLRSLLDDAGRRTDTMLGMLQAQGVAERPPAPAPAAPPPAPRGKGRPRLPDGEA